MKITHIETFVVDAGWRPWIFASVETDQGITGYGEMSDRNPYGIIGAVNDLKSILIGEDPTGIERLYWSMYRVTRQSPGGIAAKAISGIELALWDIKGKSLGVPVHNLFGGPVRSNQRVYWSHCGTSRARAHKLIGSPPLRSMEDVVQLGLEVKNKGFTALKTNIVFPGENPYVYSAGFQGGSGSSDQNIEPNLLNHIETYISELKRGVGNEVEIALDLNFNFKPLAARQICKVLEPFEMMWVEIDMYDPAGLAEVKNSTNVPITSGENLFGLRGYRPYFEKRAMDTVMIDVPWNGFSRSRDIAMAAESHELNIAPHNYYSHLSTMISLNLCATLPNVKIMEIDIDDVPWKDELTGGPIQINNGIIDIPNQPGWGIDLDKAVALAHPWEPGKMALTTI